MRFKDVIGQDEIKAKLVQAFKENRVSHSYLFYGQILPTWQRQEEQKKGREERNFCQIYGVSEGQAQGKVTHHIPSPIRRERVMLPGDHRHWRRQALKLGGQMPLIDSTQGTKVLCNSS